MKNQIESFTSWLTSYVPEFIRVTVIRRVDRLNERVNRILEPEHESEYEDALENQD